VVHPSDLEFTIFFSDEVINRKLELYIINKVNIMI